MAANDKDSTPQPCTSDHSIKPTFKYQPKYVVMKDKKMNRTNTACGPWTHHHIIFDAQLPGETSTSRWSIGYRIHTHNEHEDEHLEDFFDYIKERVAYAVCQHISQFGGSNQYLAEYPNQKFERTMDCFGFKYNICALGHMPSKLEYGDFSPGLVRENSSSVEDEATRLVILCEDIRARMVRIDPHNGFAVFDIPEGKIEICTEVSVTRERMHGEKGGGNGSILYKKMTVSSMVNDEPADALARQKAKEPEVEDPKVKDPEWKQMIPLMDLDVTYPAEILGEEWRTFNIPYIGLYYYPLDGSYISRPAISQEQMIDEL